ncbi:hypothetical protein KKKH31_02870 [Helicobacter pylori]
MKSARIGSKIVMMVCAVVIVISAVMGVIISYKVESVLQSQATELLQKKAQLVSFIHYYHHFDFRRAGVSLFSLYHHF